MWAEFQKKKKNLCGLWLFDTKISVTAKIDTELLKFNHGVWLINTHTYNPKTQNMRMMSI